MLRKPGVGTVNAPSRSPFWLTPIPPIVLPAAMSVSHQQLPAAPFLLLTTAPAEGELPRGKVNHAHLPLTAYPAGSLTQVQKGLPQVITSFVMQFTLQNSSGIRRKLLSH